MIESMRLPGPTQKHGAGRSRGASFLLHTNVLFLAGGRRRAVKKQHKRQLEKPENGKVRPNQNFN
jgi:hypothetical protein